MADTFLDMLNEANSIVTGDYPTAQFYEAARNTALLGSPWRFVFNDPSTSPNSTVMLYNFEGTFKLPPQHIDSPWLADRAIRLPIHLGVAEAQEFAVAAGYTGAPSAVTLRWPLYPGVDEPKYIFTIPSENVYVFVGVLTRKVTTEPITQESTADVAG